MVCCSVSGPRYPSLVSYVGAMYATYGTEATVERAARIGQLMQAQSALEPDHYSGESKDGEVVGTLFLVAGCYPAELLEAVDQAFGSLPLHIQMLVELLPLSLVSLPGYDNPYALLAQVTAYLAAVVSLVGYYPLGSRLPSAPAWSLDLSLFHEFPKDHLLVPLSRSEHEHHGLPSAFGPQMHLGTEAALATTQRFVATLLFRANSVLMRPDDSRIQVMHLPVDLFLGISLLLKGLKDMSPYSCPAPTVEPTGASATARTLLVDLARALPSA
jgi:hypothetical protein